MLLFTEMQVMQVGGVIIQIMDKQGGQMGPRGTRIPHKLLRNESSALWLTITMQKHAQNAH